MVYVYLAVLKLIVDSKCSSFPEWWPSLVKTWSSLAKAFMYSCSWFSIQLLSLRYKYTRVCVTECIKKYIRLSPFVSLFLLFPLSRTKHFISCCTTGIRVTETLALWQRCFAGFLPTLYNLISNLTFIEKAIESHPNIHIRSTLGDRRSNNLTNGL